MGSVTTNHLTVVQPSVIRACAGWALVPPSSVANAFLATADSSTREVSTVVRIVLPYRREWASIGQTLRSICHEYFDSILAETRLRIELSVSWSVQALLY